MSTSVCLSLCVCLSVREHISRDRYQIFVHVAYRRGSILLRRGDTIPRESGNFVGFYTFDNALYSMAFGTHTKTAKPIEMPFVLLTRVGLRYHVLDLGPDPLRARSNL